MRILLTGASGFVGSAACSRLETAGHEVIRWIGPGREPNGASISVDVADESTFPPPETMGQLDAVVHCAGIAHRFAPTSTEDFDRINVRGVANTVRFAERAGTRKFILLSSVLVYGQPRNDETITEEFPPHPEDEYAKSKLAGEAAAIRISEAAGIELVILRPAPIIGEGSRGNVSRLIRAIDRGRFVWIGDGRNKRTFVYVGDVARAVRASLECDGPLSSFNVTGDTITVAALVETIEHALKKKTPRFKIPNWTAKVLYHGSAVASPFPTTRRYRRTLATWLADGVYSGAAFRDRLGFTAETTIEEAIKREVSQYLRNK